MKWVHGKKVDVGEALELTVCNTKTNLPIIIAWNSTICKELFESVFAIKYVTIWILTTCLASEEAVEHYLWESETKKIWHPEQVDEG